MTSRSTRSATLEHTKTDMKIDFKKKMLRSKLELFKIDQLPILPTVLVDTIIDQYLGDFCPECNEDRASLSNLCFQCQYCTKHICHRRCINGTDGGDGDVKCHVRNDNDNDDRRETGGAAKLNLGISARCPKCAELKCSSCHNFFQCLECNALFCEDCKKETDKSMDCEDKKCKCRALSLVFMI